MDNSEVVALVAAGVSEETIVVAINNAPESEFDTAPQALIALKDAGASETILQAVLARAASPGPGTAPSASEDESTPGPGFQSVEDEAALLPPQVLPKKNGRYFTRFTLHYERDEWPATNYSRGTILPINTEVELVKMKRKSVKLRILETGETLECVNIRKYTNQNTAEFATQLLSSEPTRIEAYGDEIADMLRNGVLRLGMTKQQVLLSRGYPPRHETPSIEGNQWVYWSSRFVKRTLAFQDGVLVRGRGLH